MSVTVDNNGNISGVGLTVNGEQLDTEKSIQFIFAQLQNELAKSNKDKALGIIDEIKSSQNEAKNYSELLNTAREYRNGKVWNQADCEAYHNKLREAGISDSMINNVTWHVKELRGGSTEPVEQTDAWLAGYDALIETLKSKQEQCGTDIQQKMVFVQDWIGQYNAYQQGASTAISQANQTLTSLAKGQ